MQSMIFVVFVHERTLQLSSVDIIDHLIQKGVINYRDELQLFGAAE
jgi:hypothetical protein